MFQEEGKKNNKISNPIESLFDMVHNHANKSLDDIKIIISMIRDVAAGMVHLHVKILKKSISDDIFQSEGIIHCDLG